jgi:GT2 family glycosyltransferase
MVEFLDIHPNAGAVGGRLLNPDGSFQAGYARFSTLHEEFFIATGLGGLFWKGYPCHYDTGQVQPVDWLSAACLLLRRKTLEQVGLLDEDYFIYGDEVDLQFRLKQAGWNVYYLPSATTIHYGGRSMDRWRRRKMVYRGKLLFYRKNYGPSRTAILRGMFGSLSLIKLIAWTGVCILPKWRARAKRELSSNLDVLKLCWKLT